MTNATLIPDNPEYTSTCTCCSTPMHAGCGAIHIDGKEVGSYWYQWSEGHRGTFDLAIAWQSADEKEYVAAAWARPSEQGLHYGVHEVDQSPWGNMNDYGTHLGKEAMQQHPDFSLFWQYADLLASKEPHLAPRVKAHFGVA